MTYVLLCQVPHQGCSMSIIYNDSFDDIIDKMGVGALETYKHMVFKRNVVHMEPWDNKSIK